MTTWVRFSRYAACLVMITGLVTATSCASADVGDLETYRCNVPGGQGDGVVYPFASTGTTISGRISLHSADVSTQWGSVVKILAHQHDAHNADADCGCNGIAIYAFKNPDHIEFYTTVDGQEVPLQRAATFDTPITFKIEIDPKGAMTVTIGKTHLSTQTVKLRHPEHDTVELTCSGADASFLNVATSSPPQMGDQP